MIGSADNKSQSAYLSFEALNQIMQNMDLQQFDYDGFKQIYDANPDVQNLVKNFDDKGITLSTKQEADSDTPTKTTDPADATVDQMAKKAAKI